jgi:anti-sigma regulatory factor (Ser/Thr protein kinase)
VEIYARIKLPAHLEYLSDFIDFVATCSREQGFEKKRVHEIELATEEALVNIFDYAYKDDNGDVEIICKLDNNKRFIIEVVDTGIPFNVLSVASPDIAADISERQLGGLGVFLIKKFMDAVQYRYEGNKNILSLIIKRGQATL